MAFSNGYTIGFAAVVCVVCALGVSSATLVLRPYQEINRTRALQGKVLAALDVHGPDGEPLTGKAIDEAYATRVKEIVIDRDGNEQTGKTLEDVLAERKAAKAEGTEPDLLPVYLRVDGDRISAYALELHGVGLWGPIGGYLALNPDGRSVLGATFDAPKETPGLGAEITEPEFQAMWSGKSIVDKQGHIDPVDVGGRAVLACPGRVENCVDGVSGATITTRGTDAMIEDALLDDYKNYLVKIQGGAS